MKAKPILFNSEMVRALLDGRKTQTRRICKAIQHNCNNAYFTSEHGSDDFVSPFGMIGGYVWVRESCHAEELSRGPALGGVAYVADDYFRVIENSEKASNDWFKLFFYRGGRGAIVSSIHMPKWASRITLKITDIRIERLQDINEIDAKAEGVGPEAIPGEAIFGLNHTKLYMDLYDSINAKKHPWSSNPWVWVIEFKVIKDNIDKVLK